MQVKLRDGVWKKLTLGVALGVHQRLFVPEKEPEKVVVGVTVSCGVGVGIRGLLTLY